MSQLRWLAALLLLSMFPSGLFASPAAVPVGHEIRPLPEVGVTRVPVPVVQEILDELFFDWQVFDMDLPALEERIRRTGRVELHLGGDVFDLVLEPIDLRAEGFREEWITDDGVVTDFESPVGTFKGHLAGDPDSEVRLLVLPNLLQGYVRTEERWTFIDPLRQFHRGSPRSRIVVYDESDVRPGQSVLCGTAKLGAFVERMDLVTMGIVEGLDEASTGDVREAQIATEADYEYFLLYGSSANSQITGIINQVDGIYDDQLALKLRIVFQSVWSTTSDPYTYTNASNLLSQFRSYWNSNRSGVGRDIAHLFTGKDLDGSTVGIAWVGVVCNNSSYAYGLSQNTSLMVKLVAHEIGHNFNARHDNEFNPPTATCSGAGPIMCSSLQGAGPNSFSSRSITDVKNHVSSNSSCLTLIKRTPTACFSIKDNGFGNYTFDASCSSDPNGTIVSYSWTFSSGGSATGKVVSWSFPQGTHTVRLTVTDNDGNTALRTNLINNCLVFSPTGATSNLCTTF